MMVMGLEAVMTDFIPDSAFSPPRNSKATISCASDCVNAWVRGDILTRRLFAADTKGYLLECEVSI